MKKGSFVRREQIQNRKVTCVCVCVCVCVRERERERESKVCVRACVSEF